MTVWLSNGWNLSPFHRRCLNQFFFGAIPSNNLFYRWVLMRYGSEQLIFLTVSTRNIHLLCIAAVMTWGGLVTALSLLTSCMASNLERSFTDISSSLLFPFAALPALVDHIFIAFLHRLDLLPTLFRSSFVIVSRQNLHNLLKSFHVPLRSQKMALNNSLSLRASMCFAVSASDQVLPHSAIFSNTWKPIVTGLKPPPQLGLREPGSTQFNSGHVKGAMKLWLLQRISWNKMSMSSHSWFRCQRLEVPSGECSYKAPKQHSLRIKRCGLRFK